MFQFLIGSMKAQGTYDFEIISEFQFLIGSMKGSTSTAMYQGQQVSIPYRFNERIISNEWIRCNKWFQFLIGSMKDCYLFVKLAVLLVSIPYRFNERTTHLPFFSATISFQFLIGSMKVLFHQFDTVPICSFNSL